MDRNLAEQGVNARPAARAKSAMCLVLQGNLVRPTRFELVTSCSGGKRSIQLSYGRARKTAHLLYRNPSVVLTRLGVSHWFDQCDSKRFDRSGIKSSSSGLMRTLELERRI